MNNINLRQPYPNELYHHGIRGQKWGVRRFQNPDGTLTAAGKIRYGVGSKKQKTEKTDAVKKNGEVDKEAVAIAATLAATSVVTVAPFIPIIVSAGKRHKAQKFVSQCDEERARAKIDSKTGLKLIPPPPKTPSENAKRVNPAYHVSNSDDYRVNCPQCTLAMEMRRRGYEVQARPNPNGEYVDEFYAKTFKTKPNTKKTNGDHPVDIALRNIFGDDKAKLSCREQNDFLMSLSSEDTKRFVTELDKEWSKLYERNGPNNKNVIDNFKKQVLTEPVGSRGHVSLQWPRGYGGHSIAYEIGPKGNLILYDAQSGETLTKEKDIDNLIKHAVLIDYDRFDNLELNVDFCKKEVV